MKKIIFLTIIILCITGYAYSWTLQFSDAFTDSNGTTLTDHDAAWVADENNATIDTNRVEYNGSWARNHISTSLEDKQAVAIENYNDADFSGPCLRYTSAGSSNDNFDGYCCLWKANVMSLYERTSGGSPSWTLIDSGAATHNAGDVVRIEADGSDLQCLENGTQRASGSDSTISSGSAAIRVGQSTNQWGDNFEAYDETGAVAARRIMFIY